MAIEVKKAVRKNAYARMCIVGPAGSGKTYTALTFARELAGPHGRILGLDTEKGSMSLYDQFDFEVAELWARDKKRQPIKDPFHPDKYMEVIKYAEDNGYDVLAIDGLSQVWNDAGGFLDLLNRIATQKYKNNTWSAWKDIDPIYRKFINAITDARLHIICTMRSKTETSQKWDEKQGKNVIEKLGTAPVQRDGLEYEFTIFAKMEIDNTLIIEKTRCSAIRGAVVNCPTAEFIRPVKEWLSNGAPNEDPEPLEEEIAETQKPAPRSIETAPSTQVVPEQEPVPTLNQLKERAELLYPGRWEWVKEATLKGPIQDEDITPDKAMKLHRQLLHQEKIKSQKEAATEAKAS